MYQWLKVLHILAVVLFLGNIITGLFWHAHAARTRDARLIAFTVDGIIRSDRWFTNPGVVLIVAFGVWAAVVGGYPLLRTGWIAWPIALLTASGVIFVARVAPLQRHMLAAAEAGVGGAFDYQAYARLARRWEAWGALAVLTPLVALALMVLKPVL